MRGLVQCPKCEQRDSAVAQKFWLEHLVKLLAVLAIATVGMFFMLQFAHVKSQ